MDAWPILSPDKNIRPFSLEGVNPDHPLSPKKTGLLADVYIEISYSVRVVCSIIQAKVIKTDNLQKTTEISNLAHHLTNLCRNRLFLTGVFLIYTEKKRALNENHSFNEQLENRREVFLSEVPKLERRRKRAR
jgi:hypothetical protein